MKNSFSKFEFTITQQRKYYDEWGAFPEQIKELGLPSQLFKIDDRVVDCDVTGSHVMNPGLSDPASPFIKCFQYDPPLDFIEFYQKWNGGYLFFGVPYRLLTMDKIVEVNLRFRRIRGHKSGSPWSIVRFADIGHNDYIGYRKKDDVMVVSLILNEYHDDELLSGQFEAPIISRSFSGWIERLIEKDGALPGGIPASMKRLE